MTALQGGWLLVLTLVILVPTLLVVLAQIATDTTGPILLRLLLLVLLVPTVLLLCALLVALVPKIAKDTFQSPNLKWS